MGDLVQAGTAIAYQPTENKSDPTYVNFQADEKITEIEAWIDDLTSHLPELTSFILQTGGRSTCSAHVARSVCRRAERTVNVLKEIQQAEEGTSLEQTKNVAKYLNRLSDLLFTVARFISVAQGSDEIAYSARKGKKTTDE